MAIRTEPSNFLDLRNTGIVAATGYRRLEAYKFYNHHESDIRYVKIYDKALAPSSSDIPVLTITVFPSSITGISLDDAIEFHAGVGLRATTGIANDDSGDPSANDVSANLFFRESSP